MQQSNSFNGVPVGGFGWRDALPATVLVLFFGMQLFRNQPTVTAADVASMSPVGVLLSSVLMLALGGFVIMRYRLLPQIDALGWGNWCKSRVFIACGMSLFVVMLGGVLLNLVLPKQEEFQSSIMALVHGSLWLKIALVFSAAVVAPMVEELVFRGYLYPLLKQHTGRGIALVVVSAFFALVHGNMYGLPQLFLIAVVLTLLYEYTRCILSPILVHAAYNSLTIAFVMAHPEVVG